MHIYHLFLLKASIGFTLPAIDSNTFAVATLVTINQPCALSNDTPHHPKVLLEDRPAQVRRCRGPSNRISWTMYTILIDIFVNSYPR